MEDMENHEPENETKAERFKRIATPRLAKVTVAIRSLKKVAAPTRYEWTEAQVDVIMDHLRGELEDLEAALRDPHYVEPNTPTL